MSDMGTEVYRMHATVRGRVQGVGFRYWAHHTAQFLRGVSGYVRNMPDGSVEIEAECPERTQLEKLEKELRQGPSTARVELVDVHWEEGISPRHTGFHVA